MTIVVTINGFMNKSG